jgi:monoamine oxidase
LRFVVARSSWGSDPYARGSYSFRTVDCDRKSLGHVDLSVPVPSEEDPRLLFAGEATHASFYSTVHGAIGSGRREADRITGRSTANTV